MQASYVLMDQQATLDKVAELTGKAAAQGVQLVVFPEVFVPGTPIWIDTRPIWDGDGDWALETVLARVRTAQPSGHLTCG